MTTLLRGLGLALAFVVTAAPSATRAMDTRSQWGLGGVIGNDRSGLALRYWVDRLGFALSGGLDLFAGDETVSHLDLEAQVLFQAVRYDDTHLVLGAGLRAAFGNSGVYEGSPNAGGTDVTASVELTLAVEHFFGQHFSVAGVVGVPIELGREVTFPAATPDDETTTLKGTSIRIMAMWAAEFTFYF